MGRSDDKPAPKRRNPVASEARRSGAGVHERSRKARRQAARQKLQKALRDGGDDE